MGVGDSGKEHPCSARPMTPPAVDHVIRRCLAKDPEDRWQTARDLALEMKWIAEAGPQLGAEGSSPTRRPVFPRRLHGALQQLCWPC